MSPQETPRTQRARRHATEGQSAGDYPASSQSGDGSDQEGDEAELGIEAEASSGELMTLSWHEAAPWTVRGTMRFVNSSLTKY